MKLQLSKPHYNLFRLNDIFEKEQKSQRKLKTSKNNIILP
jgi:hypothetical protein